MGGGAIFETRGPDSATFTVIEAGGGLWLEISESSGLFAGATIQVPIGDGVNVPFLLVGNAGFDF